jgi:tetratricopeptide (TPR) repeat protein
MSVRNKSWAAICLMILLGGVAWAANEGQADLDKATEAKLEAETKGGEPTLADLEKVAALCESALKKGLDEENTGFANQLLSSVLMQHAEKLCDAIFEQSPPDRRWEFIRTVAMKDLNKALKAEPKLPDAQLLIAKLQLLPGGDRKLAKSSADEAIKLLDDNKPKQAKAYLLRAALTEVPDEQLAEMDKALEADPKSVDALRMRAFLRLSKGEHEKAVEDLLKLVEIDPSNPAVQGALAEALANIEKFDEALKHVDKVIATNPKSPLGYNLRARIRILQDKLDDAITDLNEVLKLDPNNVGALLLRSQALAQQDKFDEAKADVDHAIRLQPELSQALLLRSMISAQAKRWGAAIADIKTLLQTDPQNAEWRLQLAAYYAADSRPRKAIEILDELVDTDSDNWQARRARADALLSIGKHAKAVEDYNEALKKKPDDSHMLNNLAWVLATSTDDDVRDAKRSIEIGTKASELTKYEAPHILSTLAAGYAEAGDWDTAIKWSSKAVELSEKAGKTGDEDVSEQLKKELESYKEKKPWREKQDTEENTKPLDEKSSDLEA